MKPLQNDKAPKCLFGSQSHYSFRTLMDRSASSPLPADYQDNTLVEKEVLCPLKDYPMGPPKRRATEG